MISKFCFTLLWFINKFSYSVGYLLPVIVMNTTWPIRYKNISSFSMYICVRNNPLPLLAFFQCLMCLFRLTLGHVPTYFGFYLLSQFLYAIFCLFYVKIFVFFPITSSASFYRAVREIFYSKFWREQFANKNVTHITWVEKKNHVDIKNFENVLSKFVRGIIKLSCASVQRYGIRSISNS
jgi:hypothetical protein